MIGLLMVGYGVIFCESVLTRVFFYPAFNKLFSLYKVHIDRTVYLGIH